MRAILDASEIRAVYGIVAAIEQFMKELYGHIDSFEARIRA